MTTALALGIGVAAGALMGWMWASLRTTGKLHAQWRAYKRRWHVEVHPDAVWSGSQPKDVMIRLVREGWQRSESKLLVGKVRVDNPNFHEEIHRLRATAEERAEELNDLEHELHTI